jgi:hypothetical protein
MSDGSNTAGPGADLMTPDDDPTQSSESTESTPPDSPEPPEPSAPEGPVQLRLRKAPRYRAFGLTGTAIGVIAGIVLALSFTATGDYSIRTIAGYFAAIFGMIGAVLGLATAVLIERRRS